MPLGVSQFHAPAYDAGPSPVYETASSHSGSRVHCVWRAPGPEESYSGTIVRLLRSEEADFGEGGETATAVVSADGSFLFVGVPAGQYVIDSRGTLSQLEIAAGPDGALPRAPGVSPSGSGFSGVFTSPVDARLSYRKVSDTAYWAQEPVTVQDSDVRGVIVRLQRGSTIAGRYVWERTRPATRPTLADFNLVAQPARGQVALGVTRATLVSGVDRSLRHRWPPRRRLHPGLLWYRHRQVNSVPRTRVRR